MGVGALRFWYMRHFRDDKLYDELNKPVEGNFIVIQEGPNTWTRIREEEMNDYMRYLKEKGDICLGAYEKYVKTMNAEKGTD